jgi:hypothetical protein
METKEIKKLEWLAENSSDEVISKNAMLELRKVNATYHWCPDWDYMVICDDQIEINGCTCQLPGRKSNGGL